MTEKEKCKCGKRDADDPHGCSYAQEIGDNDDPEYCTCCEDCAAECAYAI